MMTPADIIFVLLFGLGLGCSLVAGYGMAGSTQRSWIHMIVFAAIAGRHRVRDPRRRVSGLA